jgi:hypothetical protein
MEKTSLIPPEFKISPSKSLYWQAWTINKMHMKQSESNTDTVLINRIKKKLNL